MPQTQSEDGHGHGHPHKHVPPPKSDAPFPTYQLTILAVCRFSEPIAFNSILAYTYIMVQDLNGNDTNASFYAGLLVSAYAVAEALTAMLWGAVSDRVGRKPVVLIGLGGVAISSLIFGLAQRYWVALLARFIGGALNGNVAVMQTMVAEMVIDTPQHEPKAYAVQPFVWFLGSIVGSAMGGYLAQPAKFYPDYFAEDGLFGRFPYLLPNLVAVVIIVLAVVQGIIFLDETNPRFKKQVSHGQTPAANGADDDETSPLIRVVSQPKSISENIRQGGPFFSEEGLPTNTDQRFDLRRNSFGTMHAISVRPDMHDLHHAPPPPLPPPPPEEEPQNAVNFGVVMFILVLVLAAFHQMAFGAILPIYLLDPPSYNASSSSSSSSSVLVQTLQNHPRLDLTGGMGFTLHDVGGYLAVNGFIALFIQGIIFPILVSKLGVWLSFLLPTLIYPLVYILMPFLSLLRTDTEEPWLLPAGIYATLFLQNMLGIIATPCALILLKNACPSPLVLGRINGLAMSAVCAARTVSSPLVGVVYDFGGSAAAWGFCALVAVVGAVQLGWVPKEASEEVAEVHVESVLAHGHEDVFGEDEDEDEGVDMGDGGRDGVRNGHGA